MARYSDIKRGVELKAQYDAYIKWVELSKKDKKAKYKAVANTQRVQIDRVPGWINPFDVGNLSLLFEVQLLPSNTSGTGSDVAGVCRSLVSDRFKDSKPTSTTGTVIIKAPRKQRMAKLSLTKRTETATTDSDSRQTGNPYKRHRSHTVSCPFGAKDLQDNFSKAMNEIKAKSAFDTFIKTKGNSYSFVDPEI